jgi:hypothetical protein
MISSSGSGSSSSKYDQDAASPLVLPETGTDVPPKQNHRLALAAAQEMVQQLQAQLKVAQNQQQKGHQAAGAKEGTASTAKPTVCRRIFGNSGSQGQHTIPIQIPTAMSLWTDQLEAIHAASQLRLNDPKYAFSDFTAQLLQFVTPRLPQSVMTVPAFVGSSSSRGDSRDTDDDNDKEDMNDASQWDAVGRVLEKTFAKWQYVTALQQATTKRNRLRMQIRRKYTTSAAASGANGHFGWQVSRWVGIVANWSETWACNCACQTEVHVFRSVGALCAGILTDLVLQQQQHQQAGTNNTDDNADPETDTGGRAKKGRQQAKKNKDPVDTVLPLLQVTKVAMGGTNTATGSRILEYDLIPPEARNPDIVLNAYSTNDMHVLTMNEATSGNQTLRYKLLDMTQDFVRTVLTRRPCAGQAPPLVLHLDDYLGNEQREIASTMEFSQTVNTLAQYYGIATMSYANMVRQTVYGDTRESWFSPEGWWPTPETKVMEREIHPGMGMHISVVYVVAYNILNLATTYCSMESFHAESANLEYNETAMAKRIPLKNWYTDVPGKPKATPRGLPPVLTQSSNWIT